MPDTHQLTTIAVGVGAGLLYSWLTSSSDRKVEVIDNYAKCDAAVKILRQHCNEMSVLGFDCEWHWESTDVSLLELCSHKGYCAVIRLCSLPTVPRSLIDLLMDSTVVKVGVGKDRDAELLNDNGLLTTSTLDLRFVAVLTGRVKPQNLADMYNEVLGKNLEKSIRLAKSDWEADTLTQEQINYAANQAIAGIEIYIELTKNMSNVSLFEDYYDTKFIPFYHSTLGGQRATADNANACVMQ